MKEENKIRLLRYGTGILFGVVGFLMFYFMDLIRFDTIFLQILLIFWITMATALIVWSSILIGRCESFIKSLEKKK